MWTVHFYFLLDASTSSNGMDLSCSTAELGIRVLPPWRLLRICQGSLFVDLCLLVQSRDDSLYSLPYHHGMKTLSQFSHTYFMSGANNSHLCPKTSSSATGIFIETRGTVSRNSVLHPSTNHIISSHSPSYPIIDPNSSFLLHAFR